MGTKVLIVDDDRSVARFLKEALETAGYEVTVATNGLECLSSIAELAPDLAILDVMLPGLDGYEVCHRLRSNPKTSQLPIIMWSGKGRDTDRVTGEKVGADEFLVKPVDLVEILDKVEKLL